jgi:hypothetical protein
VAQIRQNDRFQTELSRIFVSGEEVFLNSHIHAEIFIHRAINGSHPTLAEDFNNAISLMK